MIVQALLKYLRSLRARGIIPKEYIAQFLPSNPVILEAGADTGSDTLEMLAAWPGATVHAFEPVPKSFLALTEATMNCPTVHCYNLGLGSKTGTEIMYVSNTLSSSSLLKPAEHLQQHPHISFKNNLSVQVVTIDVWARAHNISRIDCLWLDLQGMELQVLKAAIRILPTVKVIYTEVSLIETYEGVALYPELKAFLMEQGFVVKQEQLPWPDMGNVLFVRE